MDYTFISYARPDLEEVRKLYKDLCQAGINCWLDVEDIPPGANWDEVLQKSIENCANFVVVCTEASMTSQNVRAEWQYAFKLQKPIHPFILAPCSIPFRLRIFQFADTINDGYETALQKLVEALSAIPGTGTATRVAVVNELPSTTNKVEALLEGAVLNWRSFGLLLDKDAFDYVEQERERLKQFDADTLQLLFLSARRNRKSIAYWAKVLANNDLALDKIEDILLDEINERFSHDRQEEFAMLASDRMVSKIVRLLELTENEKQTQLLLDAIEPILLKPEIYKIDRNNIERLLLTRFKRQPNKVVSRALGWINSAVFYSRAIKFLERCKNPLSTGRHSQNRVFLHGLAYMTMPDAIEYLKALTPEGFGFVPAGWFVMGGATPHEPFSSPHDVFVPSFWLAKTPVTNNQYTNLIHEFDSRISTATRETRGNYPVTDISWIDANRYASLLSEKIDAPVFLPTEAMWEKAASWDPVSKRKFQFPWGDEPDYTRCNTIESHLPDHTPVGNFSPQGDSPYGIQDMVGNVWEWTSSAWFGYPYHPRDGREGKGDRPRVMRGSSQDARRGSAFGTITRLTFEETYRFDNGGFRVAIVIAR
jgi:formylglycine-generating enzyme required for sulfatase activity